MCKKFKCITCDLVFKYKILKDFHNDHKHNFISYNCGLCEEVRFYDHNYTSLYQLLDHLYKFHDENIYKILCQINIF